MWNLVLKLFQVTKPQVMYFGSNLLQSGYYLLVFN